MPKFSIVIPTRERAETLYYTLRTCLAQHFDDYEIIVCDNNSSPATKQVVDSLNSNKIHYLRSDHSLAMSENWELAVSHAKGEFVIVIGDDDGLLIHSLVDLDNITENVNTKAIRWERVYYNWPNTPLSQSAHQLIIPINRASYVLNGLKTVKKAANNRIDYSLLPMLYNSAIHRDLVDEVRERAGRVFLSRSPDVSSGLAFASLAGNYLSLGRPMTINGGSAKSNGIATMSGVRSSIAEEFNILNEQSSIQWHPQVPGIQSLPTVLADSFLHIKEVFFKDDHEMRIDRKKLVKECLSAYRFMFHDKATRDSTLQQVRNSLKDDQKLLNWFDNDILTSELVSPKELVISDLRPEISKYSMTLNAHDFGADNVYDVALLCDKITGHSRNIYNWRPNQSILAMMKQRLLAAAKILVYGW